MLYCKKCKKIFFKYLFVEDATTYKESLMRVIRSKCTDIQIRASTENQIDYDIITCEVIKEDEYTETVSVFCPECKAQQYNGGDAELFNTIGTIYDPPREVVESFEFIQSLINNKEGDYVDITKLSLEEVVEVEKAFKVLRALNDAYYGYNVL